jgi:hypothetical protein
MGFVPQSKLIFHSKLKFSTGYHGKMNTEVFVMLLTKQFLPYLALKSIIVMANTSIHRIFMEKLLCKYTRVMDVIACCPVKCITHTASQTRMKLLQLVVA